MQLPKSHNIGAGNFSIPGRFRSTDSDSDLPGTNSELLGKRDKWKGDWNQFSFLHVTFLEVRSFPPTLLFRPTTSSNCLLYNKPRILPWEVFSSPLCSLCCLLLWASPTATHILLRSLESPHLLLGPPLLSYSFHANPPWIPGVSPVLCLLRKSRVWWCYLPPSKGFPLDPTGSQPRLFNNQSSSLPLCYTR